MFFLFGIDRENKVVGIILSCRSEVDARIGVRVGIEDMMFICVH